MILPNAAKRMSAIRKNKRVCICDFMVRTPYRIGEREARNVAVPLMPALSRECYALAFKRSIWLIHGGFTVARQLRIYT